MFFWDTVHNYTRSNLSQCWTFLLLIVVACSDMLLSCGSAKVETTCCSETRVKVYADGTSEWYREYKLSVSHCELDITWFPFDSQVCELIYESKTHDHYELNLTRISTEANLDSYTSNGEWELVGKLSTLATWKAKPS